MILSFDWTFRDASIEVTESMHRSGCGGVVNINHAAICIDLTKHAGSFMHADVTCISTDCTLASLHVQDPLLIDFMHHLIGVCDSSTSN